MKTPHDIILSPVVSEKSYLMIENSNTYTFLVDPRSNKTEVKQAIQEVFGVEVLRVNTQNRKGKRKRTRQVLAKRKDVKRALVTLAPGESIELFGV